LRTKLKSVEIQIIYNQNSIEMNILKLFFYTSVLLLFSCKQEESKNKAIESINEEQLAQYVKDLASDKFQGRKPFSTGEVITIEYLKNQFEKLGLDPANGNSYFQEVPMVQVTVSPDENMNIKTSKGQLKLNYKDDYVAFSKQLVDKISIENAELVFAGYGIVAPEYNWNDYKDIDVKGKIVIVMVNDPGFVSDDKNFFKGREMTYYGRWSYKYEEAARQGAAGLLIIHDTEPAGYPYSVVLNGAIIPKLYLLSEDNYINSCKLEGWLTQNAAQKLFESCGLDFGLTKEACKPGFKSIPMNATMSFNMASSQKNEITRNVMAVLKGSKRPDEVIIYSAHWDHLGIGAARNGDSIYNGAVDNGTSLAWMLEIAEAFTLLENKPERSILFFAPTAEEQGLLGSAYYTKNPIFALSKTVCNINNDLMLPYGRMKDVMVTGFGQSELDDYLKIEAEKQDRYIFPDPNPHTGMYFRADHFSFAKAGVPAIFARGNCDSRANGKEWALEKEKNWINNYYHKPTDEYEADWDLSGVKDDAVLFFELGLRLANDTVFPKWNDGSEFKAIRDQNISK